MSALSGDVRSGTSRLDGEGQKYALTSDEDEADFWGFAHEADGLFTVLPDEEGTRRVRLTGCRPQGGLLKSVGKVGRRGASAGSAWIAVLDAEGATMGSYFAGGLTVVDVRPSTRGAGLLDITVTLWCEDALPGAERVWDLIRAGGPTRTGMWHDLALADRGAWLSVALFSSDYRRAGRPDAPAGHEYVLDGRHVVDIGSFYCAIGEAVNGPGGYFGWNLDALDDCLRGGWGATAPFTLRWESMAASRARLAERRRVDDRDIALFDLLLNILEERGVDVVGG
ncbi:barstar family protein [Streptomyces sp. NPDC002566]|uniref:barstar family protein n=1 Tax=Streptomyces sp. NPDC002566 TaxID=3364650 RepID=UPI003694229D